MANIIDSLFGPTPYDIGQQRNQQDMSYAEKVARMGGFEQAKFGIGQGAAGLTRAGAGMMGMVDPLQQEAAMRDSVMSQGGDLTTSAGLKAKALQFAQAGDQRTAMKLAIAAKEAEAREQAAIFASNKDAREELKMNRDAVWKHEESLEKLRLREREIENDMKIAQQRGEDTAKYHDAMIENRRAMIAVAQMQVDSRSAIAAAKGEQPPKNLTREARLKWEVENGRIDQETYDAAMAASPGAKLQYEKNAAAKSAEIGFKSVEDNIAKLYDPKAKAIKPEANALFGKYDQYRPQIAMSQETVDAANALESLTNQVMMTNLADAKERVGQSFGSMQVQEWEKFTQQLTSLKRGLSPKAAAEAMEYVTNFIDTKRSILKAAMGQGGSSTSAAKADPLGLR